MVGIQGIDHVIGVFEEILQVLFCFLDLPRALADFHFQFLSVRLHLPFKMLSDRDIT